jgi:DNA (cytosine-5)-methyltransferase 1
VRFVSLCSGIGSAELAWAGLDWQCVAQAEIDKAACAVLQARFPGTPNLGDVSKITEADLAALGHIDLIVGGFPCQDISVAGRRKGLRDEEGNATRSGLFFDIMRLVRIARRRCGLRFLLLENVPGLFTSEGGRDFGEVVAEILGIRFDVPRDGWADAGAAASDDGLVEWATLDAQFFHLAQRRERVFLVADFGDWANRAPILLERESLLGNPAPRRETGQSVTGTLSARTEGGGGLGTDFEIGGGGNRG